jgi:hypothetical protein
MIRNFVLLCLGFGTISAVASAQTQTTKPVVKTNALEVPPAISTDTPESPQLAEPLPPSNVPANNLPANGGPPPGNPVIPPPPMEPFFDEGTPLPLMPKYWGGAEVWIGYMKPQPLIPLVTGINSGTPPILGSPNTSLLIGQKNAPNQDKQGGRFTLGMAIDPSLNLGVEMSYFYLQTLNTSQTTNDIDPLVASILGVPVRNAATNAEAVIGLRTPFRNGG